MSVSIYYFYVWRCDAFFPSYNTTPHPMQSYRLHSTMLKKSKWKSYEFILILIPSTVQLNWAITNTYRHHKHPFEFSNVIKYLHRRNDTSYFHVSSYLLVPTFVCTVIFLNMCCKVNFSSFDQRIWIQTSLNSCRTNENSPVHRAYKRKVSITNKSELMMLKSVLSRYSLHILELLTTLSTVFASAKISTHGIDWIAWCQWVKVK